MREMGGEGIGEKEDEERSEGKMVGKGRRGRKGKVE